jgi:heme-degrading monooxygenase HmoA
MYGSISRWRVKDGHQAELEALVTELAKVRNPGSRALYIYKADADPQEYWVAGVFESREAYRSNSDAGDTNANYERLRSHMEADPEWHDGEVVAAG